DRQDPRVLARHPFGGNGGCGPGAHYGMIASIDDRERKARFGIGIDQDREYCREVVVLPIILSDRYPFAGSSMRFLDVRGHGLPFTRKPVEDNVPLRVHVVAAFAVHAIGLLNAFIILLGRQEAYHLAAAED